MEDVQLCPHLIQEIILNFLTSYAKPDIADFFDNHKVHPMMLFRVCLISRNYYNVIRHMLLSYDKVEVGSMIDYDGDKISAILFNRICYSPEEPIVMSAYMAIYWLNIAQKKRLLQLRASCRDYSKLWSYMAIPEWEEIAVIYFREQSNEIEDQDASIFQKIIDASSESIKYLNCVPSIFLQNIETKLQLKEFRTNKVEEIEVISKKTNIEVTKLVAYIAYGTSFPFYLTSARTMEIVIDGFDLGCLRNSRSIEAYVTNDCTERLQLEIESGDLCEFDDISIFFRLLSKVYTNLKEVKLSVWLARSLPWDKPERLKSCLEKSNQLINNYIMAIETQPKSRFKIEIHLEINETLMQKKDEIDRVFDEVLPDLEKKREEFRISTFNSEEVSGFEEDLNQERAKILELNENTSIFIHFYIIAFFIKRNTIFSLNNQ